MKIWKKVTALVLSLAVTLSASATVLAQAPSIKEGHVTTTASVTNDGICINGKYYTKVQFKHLLNKAQKTETVQPYDLGDAGALIAGTWWIPGIGEVIVTTAGLVIVAGVIYEVGTWVYDTVTQWFAERAEQAYEDAKNTGEPTDKHSTQSTSEGSSLPKTGTPYSSKDLEDSEGVKQRRYYDKNGNADMDIDYRHGGTGHTFPHRHDWNNGVRGPAY